MNIVGKAGRVLTAFLMLFTLDISAGALIKDIVFDNPPSISQKGGYSQISLPGTSPFISTGKPVIPLARVNIPLPQGAENVEISATAGDVETIALPTPPGFALPPVSTDSSPTRYSGTPDSAIYSNNAFFPASNAELRGVFTKNGQKIAAIRVFPARVNPVSREILLAKSIRLEISYTEPSSPTRTKPLLLAAQMDSSRQYIVITTNTLVEAFSPLVNEKRADGISAEIITVDYIYATYSGRDAPEKIRACITDNHNNHGTKYVMLGGDHFVVPARKIHAEVKEDEKTTAEDIPCDLYYACLDGSWDNDGDGKFGETNDGENSDEIDLLAEVYVGRVPVQDAADVANFLAKNTAAPSRPNPDSAKFIAEFLGKYDGMPSFGGSALDIVAELFPGYDISWLDDRPQTPPSAPSWSQNTVIEALSASPNIVAHIGHGQTAKTMGLASSGIHSLSNSLPFLITSTACHIGSFDKTSECFAKAMIGCAGGAFAAQMNTRQGWFSPGYEIAFSGEFMYNFLLNVLWERMPLGEAHFKSKEALLSGVEYDGDTSAVYRWCYLENTLFGDPLAKPSLPDPMAVTQVSFENAACISQSEFDSDFTFTISNMSPEPITVSMSIDSETLEMPPVSVEIPPVSDTNVTLKVNLKEGVIPTIGRHAATAFFTNQTTSHADSFDIFLSLIPAVHVSNSSETCDDFLIDFGTVVVGDNCEETITLSNTSAIPFTVQSICNGGRILAGAPRPTDFNAYDHTSGRLCSFSTDSRQVSYRNTNFPIDALCMVPGDSVNAYCLVGGGFYKFNLATLRRTKISNAYPSLYSHIWTALAFNQRDGHFYATSVNDNPNEDNTTTFYLLQTNGTSKITLETIPGNFNSLAIDKSGQFFSINVDEKTLCKVNPFTGEIEEIGQLDDEINYSQSLDFDSSGAMLFWSATTEYESLLRIIDTETAKYTTLSSLPIDDGQIYAPELEMAALPAESPFFATGVTTPLKILPDESATMTVSFIPENVGTFTNEFSFALPGTEIPFATVTCIGTAIPDSGIPIWWLKKYALATDGSATYTDTDGDGVSNINEYKAGTSPVDATSKFSISAFTKVGSNRYSITWPSVPGFSYSVEATDNLNTPFRSLGVVTSTETESSCTISTSATNIFFKLKR